MPKQAKLVNVSDEATTYEEVVETLLEQNETTPVTELDTEPLVPITETVEKPKRVRTKSVKPVESAVTLSTDNTLPLDEPVEKPKRVRTKPAKPTVEVTEPPPEPIPEPIPESPPESSPEPPPTPTPKAKSKAKAKAQPAELSGKVIRVLTPEEVEAKKKARPKREPKPKLSIEAPKVRQSRALMRAQLYEQLAISALP